MSIQQVHEIRPTNLAVRKRRAHHEILALEIFDERMVRVESGRRPPQRLSGHAASRTEFTARRDFSPMLTVRGDGQADSLQRSGLRTPNSRTDRRPARLQMQVVR